MIIENIDKVEITELTSFNNLVFHDRGNVKRLFDFWFGKQQDNYGSVLKGDNGEIWGQILKSSFHYFFEGEKFEGTWIFDYIIREDKRKDGYGLDLLLNVLQNKESAIFATGSGPLALKIELKLGFHLFGELKKYVCFHNFLFLPLSFFRGNIPPRKYPLSVSGKSIKFQRITLNQIPNFTKQYNIEYIEFGRDFEFLKWRFFSNFHDYVFYKSITSNDYFVLRTIVKNGITCLVLVDYRCNLKNESFEEMLQSVTLIASKLNLSVIISGSSLKITDSKFESFKFKTIGRPRPIISTGNFKKDQELINNREFVFATLADSDGEVSW